jgi:hypothetical protein
VPSYQRAYIPPRQNERTIIPGLLESIITLTRDIVRPLGEDSEFLIHIPIQERKQRHDRQHQVRHERGHHFRERVGNTIFRVSGQSQTKSTVIEDESSSADIRPRATSRTLSRAAKLINARHPCLTCSPAVWPTRSKTSVLSSSPRMFFSG